jgi:hypothetical protein
MKQVSLLALTLASMGFLFPDFTLAPKAAHADTDTAGWDHPEILELGEVLHRNINRRIVGENVLPLRVMLGLDQSYEGYQLGYVKVRMRTARGNGIATLAINGRATDRQQIGTVIQDYYFSPAFHTTIGDDIQMLRLRLNGDFYIESITVQLFSAHLR